jgi:hypothetical protein
MEKCQQECQQTSLVESKIGLKLAGQSRQKLWLTERGNAFIIKATVMI